MTLRFTTRIYAFLVLSLTLCFTQAVAETRVLPDEPISYARINIPVNDSDLLIHSHESNQLEHPASQEIVSGRMPKGSADVVQSDSDDAAISLIPFQIPEHRDVLELIGLAELTLDYYLPPDFCEENDAFVGVVDVKFFKSLVKMTISLENIREKIGLLTEIEADDGLIIESAERIESTVDIDWLFDFLGLNSKNVPREVYLRFSDVNSHVMPLDDIYGPDKVDDTDIDGASEFVEPPVLDSEPMVLASAEDSENAADSVMGIEEWCLFIAGLQNIYSQFVEEEYKKYDAPDSDPLLNALEGFLDEDLEVTSADTNLVMEDENRIPDIPVYSNKKIEAFIRLYTVKKREVFNLAIERSAIYMGMIDRIFKEYGLPRNLAYLAVVESNFNPEARSRANAVGLWQFMSYTGKVFDLNNSWWHDDRYDPEKSTIAAARYLKRLHKRFNGDWELALAAYNSGGGTVRKAIRRAKKAGTQTDYWHLRLPRETRGYVPAFYAVATIFADLEKFGFNQPPPKIPESQKKPLTVAGGISLRQIADVLKLEVGILDQLNPSLRMRGLTPATYETYAISIPERTVISDEQFQLLDKLAADREDDWKIHKVKRGESLWSISKVYNIPIAKIRAFNRLKRKNLINIGQKLMLPVPKTWSVPPDVDPTKITVANLDKLPGITYIHKVKKGDTLWSISTMYDIPIADIRRWNTSILKKRYLKVGAEIVLKLPVALDNPT